MQTEYFSIRWMNKANHYKTETKTMIDRDKLVTWANENLENGAHADYMITQSSEPTKHKSVAQEGLYFWAEPINELPTNIILYCVTCQVDGYPATKGFDDWLSTFEDADDIAYRLSRGENVGDDDLFN